MTIWLERDAITGCQEGLKTRDQISQTGRFYLYVHRFNLRGRVPSHEGSGTAGIMPIGRVRSIACMILVAAGPGLTIGKDNGSESPDLKMCGVVRVV